MGVKCLGNHVLFLFTYNEVDTSASKRIPDRSLASSNQPKFHDQFFVDLRVLCKLRSCNCFCFQFQIYKTCKSTQNFIQIFDFYYIKKNVQNHYPKLFYLK